MEGGSSSQFKPRSKYVLETVNNTRKNRMHGAIKRGDLAAVVTYIESEGFPVNEEISVAGYFWTSLHYAGHFGMADILAYVIEKLYNDFDSIKLNVNVQTREGWTPLMIAAIYGQTDCVKLLVRSGAAEIFEKDIKGKTAKDLALFYKKDDVYKFLQETENGLLGSQGGKIASGMDSLAVGGGGQSKAFNRTVTQIGALSSDAKAIDDKTIEENRELLMKGYRLPCLLCLENKGLMQYLVCCGHPIHPLCWPMEMRNVCPSCRYTGFVQLSSEVTYADRALTMDQNDVL